MLELCMERCIGDPSLSEAELRAAAKEWVAKTQAMPGLIPQVNPAKGILRKLLGVQSVNVCLLW